MGIMPDIDRVWITMNQRLYLWDYIEGQSTSFETYEKGPEVIKHVALVPAKRGVFVDSITHVLVLSQGTTLSLVGIAAPPGPVSAGVLRRRELTMFETDIVVQTGKQAMTSIVGTPEGRIFMCGMNDGALYEMYYQSNETWVGLRSKAGITNHSVGGFYNLAPSLFASSSGKRFTSRLDLSLNCALLQTI